MRVLQVHNHYRQPGGEDAVVQSDAALLRGAGHEVLGHFEQNPTAASATAARLATASWNPAARRRLRQVAEDVRPDVAHVHNTWFVLTPAAIAGLCDAGVPVVMTLHNFRVACAAATLFRDGSPCTDCVGTHPWRGLQHRCYQGSAVASMAAASTIAFARRSGVWYEGVERFLPLTNFVRDIAIRSGIPAEKIIVRSNVVDDPGPRSQPPSASRTLLYVGRIHVEKGIDVLLEAWRRAAPEHLRLEIIGEGKHRAALERGAPPGVRFRGWADSGGVRDAMRSARALVFPSVSHEGQGLTVLEAFGAGLPVLCSDLGGPASEVGGVAADWLVPPGDVTAWAAALVRLESRSDIDAVGRLARARYDDRYTPQAGLQTLEAAYAEAIKAHREV